MKFGIINYWKHYKFNSKYFIPFKFFRQHEKSERINGYIYQYRITIFDIEIGFSFSNFTLIKPSGNGSEKRFKEYDIIIFNFCFRIGNMIDGKFNG